jgi:hypothetical protein
MWHRITTFLNKPGRRLSRTENQTALNNWCGMRHALLFVSSGKTKRARMLPGQYHSRGGYPPRLSL